MSRYSVVFLIPIALSAATARDLTSHIGSQQAVQVVDSEVSQYVAVLGNRLAYAVPEARVSQYRFILYDDNVGLDVPAFGRLERSPQVTALPGGIVLVPLSLFDVAADESEFASAMARGIAHVALHHLTRYRRIAPNPRFAQPQIFPRSFEREADYAALAILAVAGFNPKALVRHVRNGLASFDTSDSRVQYIDKTIANLPPRTYGPADSLQFEMLKAARHAGRATV